MIELKIPGNKCKERTFLIGDYFMESLNLAFKLTTTSINNYR